MLSWTMTWYVCCPFGLQTFALQAQGGRAGKGVLLAFAELLACLRGVYAHVLRCWCPSLRLCYIHKWADSW